MADCKISDYESCAICGYDHSYDFPMLSEEELAQAESSHLDFEYQCMNERDYPGA